MVISSLTTSLVCPKSSRQKARAVVKFNRVLKEVLWCLVTEGGISYRRIKLSYGLDDDAVEELRRELISAKRLAADVDGERLVWAPGRLPLGNEPSSLSRQPLPPLRDSAPARPVRRHFPQLWRATCRVPRGGS